MDHSEPVTTAEYAYTAVYEPAEEARAMAVDALRCLIEGHLEDGLPIPHSDVDAREAMREPVTLKLT